MAYLDGYLGGYVGLGTAVPGDTASVIPSDKPRVIAELMIDGMWTDISAYVQAPVHISRGRSADLQRPGAGTASFALLNRNGEFDRDNPSSPYWPHIRPNLPVRFSVKVPSGIGGFRMGASPLGARNALGGTDHIDEFLFTGKTEGGPINVGQVGQGISNVSWSAADAFKQLTRDENYLNRDAGNVLSGAWVNVVLDSSSPPWPASERRIEPGTRGVVLDVGTRTEHLGLLLQIADSEGGLFFMDGEGKAVFYDATHAPAPGPVVYGDVPGEARYHDIDVADEDSLIINAVTVSAPGLSDQTAEDVASQAENGRIDYSLSTNLAGEGDMADRAADIITGYSQPRRRISTLVLGTRVMDWRSILAVDLWDRVVVRMRSGYGTTIEHVCRIEGIEHAIGEENDHKVTWHLSSLPVVASSSNLLTENQSSMEINAGGWYVESSTTPGVTLSELTGEGRTFIGAQALGINTPPATQASIRSQPFDTARIVVGQTYRGTGYMASNQGAVFGISIVWLDLSGALVSTSAGPSVVVNPAGPFRKVSVDGVAPIGAAYAAVVLSYTNPWPLSGGLGIADAISLVRV